MSKLIDTEFYAPRYPVTLVCIGADGETRLFRDFLESVNAVMHIHYIGTPSDFLRVLNQPDNPPSDMVICGHGTEKGIVLGEYGPGIDTSMLIEGCMPPECIASHIRLPGCTVLNTCCLAGASAMAQAFLTGGLDAHIGYDGYPEGSESVLFTLHYFYYIIYSKHSRVDAWHLAASFSEDSRLWKRYGGAKSGRTSRRRAHTQETQQHQSD